MPNKKRVLEEDNTTKRRKKPKNSILITGDHTLQVNSKIKTKKNNVEYSKQKLEKMESRTRSRRNLSKPELKVEGPAPIVLPEKDTIQTQQKKKLTNGLCENGIICSQEPQLLDCSNKMKDSIVSKNDYESEFTQNKHSNETSVILLDKEQICDTIQCSPLGVERRISNDSVKTIEYNIDETLPVRPFSPIPSTSKDNKIIQENEERFQESFLYDKSCDVSTINDKSSLNINQSSQDVVLIEKEYETIVLDDTCDSPLNDNNNNIEIAYPEVILDVEAPDGDVEFVDSEPSFLSAKDLLNKDTELELIAVDELIAENNAVINKFDIKNKYKKDNALLTITLDDSTDYDISSNMNQRNMKTSNDASPSKSDTISSTVTNFFSKYKPNQNLALCSYPGNSFITDFANIVASIVSKAAGHVSKTKGSFKGKNSTSVMINEVRNNSNTPIDVESYVINNIQDSDDDSVIITDIDPNIIEVSGNRKNISQFKTELSPIQSQNNVTPKKVEPPSRNLGECPICMDNLATKPIASTLCGHIFCISCIDTAIKANGRKCPTCRKLFKKNQNGYHPIFI